MTPGQCRAARLVLGWTQADLAERTGARELRVSRVENGRESPASTEERRRHCFQAAGVRFEGDWGVCLKARGRAEKRTQHVKQNCIRGTKKHPLETTSRRQ